MSQEWPDANVQIKLPNGETEEEHHELLGVLRAYDSLGRDAYVVPMDNTFKIFVLEE